MSIAASQVAVSTTEVLLHRAGPSGAVVHLHNHSGANEVYLGPTGVTSSTGYMLDATTGGHAQIKLALGPGEALYGICAAAESTTVSVLAVSR